jgi:plastocyanin
MRHPLRPLLVLLAPLALTFCSNDNNNSVNPPVNANVSMLDQCDAASFNAGIGAGTCTTAGSVTLAAFNSELAANHSVAAWKFDPSAVTITLGGTILATNGGGEVHTFTEVDNFGGGIVQSLNDASGNSVEAPECKNITNADKIIPGASMKTDAETSVGTKKYQCCIHPWMRETVTVTGA